MFFCNVVSSWAQLVSFFLQYVKLSRIVIYRSKIVRMKCSLDWSCISYGELHCDLIDSSLVFFYSLLSGACISFLGNSLWISLTVFGLFCNYIATLWSGKTMVSVLHANLISCRVGFVLSSFCKSNFSCSLSFLDSLGTVLTLISLMWTGIHS